MNPAPQLGPREYAQLAALLSRWTGIKLHGREHMMLGRLQPRLRQLRLSSFSAYLKLLEKTGRGGDEAQHFINALTTNKTAFFREAHHFEFLVQRLFPELRAHAAATGKQSVRLWSAGCSSGAEPYTLAILAQEHLPAAQGWNVRILATDVDTNVLAEAEHAVYDADQVEAVPAELRERYFVCEGEGDDAGFKLQRTASALVRFAQANLIAAPFPVRGCFDAIFCRNVLIYFDRATQQRIVGELVRCVAGTGYLVVGHSESMVALGLPRAAEAVGVYRPHAVHEAAPARTAAAPAPAPTPAPRPQLAPIRSRRPPAPASLPIKRIVLGEWYATGESMLIGTLLGSCVSACLFDPVQRVAGMNHFMLPRVLDDTEGSARFGIHAMELLINGLMRLGAERRNLRAMAFGAGAVNRALASRVASVNGEFVRDFLQREHIPLTVERLGGDKPREVYLRTDTGEAFVRCVAKSVLLPLSQRELLAYTKPADEPTPFDPADALF